MRSIKNSTGKNILVSDLKREDQTMRRMSEAAMRRVLKSGWYILGRELEAFEKEFSRYLGSSFAVGVASGTEALQLSLAALSIGAGDEVITAVNTAIPTAMAIVASGATPKFVDVEEDTFNIDVSMLEKAVTKRTKAIIPVHLYGNPCDIGEILKIARKHNLSVIEDACQAHGASYKGKKVGTFGVLGAFSFYPTKNLGCYGDGGMVVTDNWKLADKMRSLRNYGQSSRYSCEMIGINSRLDEIQASVLKIKLNYLDRLNNRRKEIAAKYSEFLKDIPYIKLPNCNSGSDHVFHLYVIICKNRNTLKDYLRQRGVETQIHYPIPLHLQKAMRFLGYKKGDFPVTEKLSGEILSLPIFPDLKDNEIKLICDRIKGFYER